MTERPRALCPLLLDERVERRDGLAGALPLAARDAVERAGVERHDDGPDAARPERGHGPDPRRVGRGGDEDRGHAPAEAAGGLDERLDERRGAVAIDRGEKLHDLEVLAGAAVGRQDRGAMGVDRHAHRPVLEDRLVGDGRRDPDRDLDRRFVTAAGLDRPVEVEDDPGVGRLLELELLDLDLAVAGRRPPVDPVEAVARRPRPDGRRERRRLERPLGRRLRALDVGRGQAPQRDPLDPGIDDDRDALADGRRRLEEPERVAGPDLERLDPEVAAPDERDPDEPRPLALGTQRDRPAGQAARQRRRVVDLEPRLGDAARVPERVGHPDPVADVAVELADRVAGLEVGQAEAGRRCTTRRSRGSRGRRGRRGTSAPSRTRRSAGCRR